MTSPSTTPPSHALQSPTEEPTRLPPASRLRDGSAGPMTPTQSAREKQYLVRLENEAVVVGRAWAASCSERLRREGRRAAGGWPGTLSEARTQLAAHVLAHLGPEVVLSYDDIERLVKAIYSAARGGWLSKASRDPES